MDLQNIYDKIYTRIALYSQIRMLFLPSTILYEENICPNFFLLRYSQHAIITMT